MGRLTPIVAGLSHDRLDREGGIQWPCPSADHPGTPNLYTENFPRPNGLARLTPVRQGPAAMELPDDEYPIILNTRSEERRGGKEGSRRGWCDVCESRM